jgi:hypothetical protein
MNIRFTIKYVIPIKPLRLTVTFGDGATMDIDMSTIVSKHAFMQPLNDPSIFSMVRVDSSGNNIIWNDEINFAGDNLRAEGTEQMGGISHERIWNWMDRNKLTLDAAAKALGISRRMLAYYRNGEKPIPKYVWLACLGWEHSL